MSEKIEILRELVREEFEAWREEKRRVVEATGKTEYNRFVNAWAMTTYLAEAERDAKNHEINKLQQRIHRQRVANREMLERARRAEELEAKLERELQQARRHRDEAIERKEELRQKLKNLRGAVYSEDENYKAQILKAARELVRDL